MAILDAIREACASSALSTGVRLNRAGAVVLDHQDPEEVVLKVLPRGAPRAFQVHLWPKEEDWSCDCSVQHDGCAHAAAAVISWSHADRRGDEMPRGLALNDRPLARIVYRLHRHPRGFRVERFTTREGKWGEERLSNALSSLAPTERVIVNAWDLEVETAIGFRFGLVVPRERVPRVLRALSEVKDLTLDDVPVKAEGRPIVPVARIEDATHGAGFKVRIVRDPSITEAFHNGAVLCTDTCTP